VTLFLHNSNKKATTDNTAIKINIKIRIEQGITNVTVNTETATEDQWVGVRVSDQFWDPPGLLSNGYNGVFPQGG
jgi:formiminotetrahydrofolate cyclodeaminase